MDMQKGDTIIELVLAFAIFSLAAVGTMTILNNGVATTQRSLETTLVRQQIDTQAEMIRYLRDTKDPAWQSLVSPSVLVTNPLPLSESCSQLGSISQGFYIQPTINSSNPSSTVFTRRPITSLNYIEPQTYAKINYSDGATQTQGIWMQATEAQQNNSSSVRAYDFYIHACWNSVGTRVPMTVGSIVRIYE